MVVATLHYGTRARPHSPRIANATIYIVLDNIAGGKILSSPNELIESKGRKASSSQSSRLRVYIWLRGEETAEGWIAREGTVLVVTAGGGDGGETEGVGRS